MEEIMIRPAAPSQQVAIANLAEDCLGEGDCVEKWFSLPTERRVLLTACQGDQVLGFHFGYLDTLGQALADLSIPGHELGNRGLLTGVPKAIGVRPDCRRQGLAERMLTAGVQALLEQNPELLLTCAWRMGNTVAMEPILRRLGFSYWQELLHPWLNAGLYCSYCRSTRCLCNGAIFLRWTQAKEN